MKDIKIKVILGIVLFLTGIKMYITEWSALYGFPIPKETGLLVSICGSLFLIIGIYQYRKAKIERKK